MEMGYMSLVARAAGIPVDGVDWWKDDSNGIRRTNTEREDQIASNVYEHLSAMGSILICLGFSHVHDLVERLREKGYVKTTISAKNKAILFDTSGIQKNFPEGMASALEHRIAADERQLSQTPSVEIFERVRNGLTVRKKLLLRVRTTGERS